MFSALKPKRLLSAAAPETLTFYMAVVVFVLYAAAGRREDSMNYSRSTRSSPDELQFWLRGRGIVATLSSFQFTATVES